MDKESSVFTLVGATFSFIGTHHFQGGLKHSGIDIRWTNKFNLETDDRQLLIINALKWASIQTGQEVKYVGIGNSVEAEQCILIPINY